MGAYERIVELLPVPYEIPGPVAVALEAIGKEIDRVHEILRGDVDKVREVQVIRDLKPGDLVVVRCGMIPQRHVFALRRQLTEASKEGGEYEGVRFMVLPEEIEVQPIKDMPIRDSEGRHFTDPDYTP